MAAPAEPAAPVSAQLVGNAFVQQYYHILHQSPGLVHRFYQDISKLGRPEEDGTMSTTTTMDEINAKILSLNYEDFKAEIKSVDSQESLNGGVNVLVTGYLTGKDNVLQNFTQSFFLAPQDKGYFVLNDIFRYMENANHHEENNTPTVEAVAPATPEQVAPEVVEVVEKSVVEEAVVLKEETEAETVVLKEETEAETVVSVENGVGPTVEEEEPVPEVINEVPEPVVQPIVESNIKAEDLPKKSYASIVMDLKQNGSPFSSQAPRKPQPKKQEQHVNNVPVTTVTTEPIVTNVDAVENGNHEEEVEGYSVYIKGLPMSATPAVLDEEFKKFGAIKPNGIQVRSNRGFCFGFVEFETAEAVQKAIEASPIIMSGHNVVVEEKRSTNSRGGSRGRFVGGRGGPGFVRNDGMRGGRGNFGGGRGYNRGGDYGGARNDYGYRGGNNSRGGASNRGGDGYQRDNNGGGRVNRGGDVNGTARNTQE